MTEEKHLTILIPVYMESSHILDTVNATLASLTKTGIHDFEILIIDCLRPDNSHDGTPAIAAKLATENPKIRHIHNHTCVNLGYKYKQGIKEARGKYFMMIPGDNENTEQSIVNVLEKIGQADIIIPFTENPKVRPLSRRIIAKSFVILCNLISGLKLKYYNGICLHKTEVLRKLPLDTDSFAYSADIIIKSLRSGLAASYIEVPMPIKPQPGRQTTAFSANNIKSVVFTLLKLFWDIRIKNKSIITSSSGKIV